jgi:hypothetical protein
MWGRVSRSIWLVGFVFLVIAGPGATSAFGYTFGAPLVQSTGPEEMEYDWTTQKCENEDIPDMPARAFRDDQNQVNLIANHYNTRRAIGSALGNVVHQCPILYSSHNNADPSKYQDKEWVYSPYTIDGHTVYALVHDEYQGWAHGSAYCPYTWSSPPDDRWKCWYNGLTLATSANSGASFSEVAAPGGLIASMPERYAAGNGPTGFFGPSNIVFRGGDGYYYSLVWSSEPTFLGNAAGICAMRTRTLGSPTSWRGWDGNAFAVRFVNPYVESGQPRSLYDCKQIPQWQIGFRPQSLTWNTYYQKYMLVGNTVTDTDTPGFYFALSDDLVHWTDRRIVMQAELPWTYQCGDPNPVRDPSVLDPASTSRNFETAGRNPYLYFKRFNYSNCTQSLDRDLIRIPIQFNGTPPKASFTTSPNPALVGQRVTFNASGSSDPNGSIAKYEWDLDGDGIFEVNSGSNPSYGTSFAKPQGGNVGLRVTDSEGLEDISYASFKVNGKLNFAPSSSSAAPGYTKDTGAPYSDSRGWGWVREDSLQSASHTPLDLSLNTRDRDPNGSDPYTRQQDGFIFMHFTGQNTKAANPTAGAFEIALPCGVYAVTASVGDSLYSSSATNPALLSTHRIQIEGQPAISAFRPTDSVKFKAVTRTVAVCDGRLTIDSIGGQNTKLNYVEVKRAAAKVNFQPDASSIPGGYAKDTGAPYSTAKGLGWVREDSLQSPTHTPLDLTLNTRDRDPNGTDSYPRQQDGFVFMHFTGQSSQGNTTAGAFEMALPCGLYTVTASVGDSLFSSSSTDPTMQSTHQVNVEGQILIGAWRPTDQTKFKAATITLPVCDGRLTVDSIGGTNTKLDYVEVSGAGWIG